MPIGVATLEISIENPHKAKINIPYNPAIPLLDICSKDTTSYSTDTCSAMLMPEVFIIAREWKQPVFLSIDKWVLKM